LIFPFGIELLASEPIPAGTGEAGPAQELLQRRQLLIGGSAPLGKQVGDEPGDALVLLGGLDPHPQGEVVGQRDRHVLHGKPRMAKTRTPFDLW
jgi:hypothetical protein